MAGSKLATERVGGGRRCGAWLATGRGLAAALSLAAAAVTAAGLIMDASLAAVRSDRSDKVRPELKTPPRGTQVQVTADRIAYNARTRVATATGRVVITYGKYVLVATEVTYDQRNDRLRAEGEVRLTEPGGNVLEADVAELWNRFRDGFAEHLRLLLTNDATITAEYARRSDGVITVYTKVTYTRCKTCVLPDGTPVWQIKSAEVTHNEDEGTIYHRDATFEFLGLPVLWLPYLSHPDPTVDRRSGFLIPSFGYSSEYGFGAEIPYFWALAPNYDITFRPLFTTKQGPLARAEWRHRLPKGQYSIDAGAIYQLDTDLRPPGDRHFRGFARTKGDFDINERWTWGWDVTATTDETFMRRYDIDERTELLSYGHLTGLDGRNYFTARALHFQGLLAGDDEATFPLVLPYVRHSYTFDRPVLGGEFGIDTNAYSLTRDEPWSPFPTVNQAGQQSRAVVEARWQRQMIGGLGQVVTPFAKMRGDIYVTDDLPNPELNILEDEQVTGRALPTIGLDMRWPFLRSDAVGQHIVTPVAQIISSANEYDEDDISKEDAIQVNFDATSLFLHDRFMGYDRFEGGTRANVGLLYTLLLPTGGFAKASFGQSYQIAGKNSFIDNSGLAGTESDLVGAMALQPFENLQLFYQARFDEATLDVQSQEAGVIADFWRLTTMFNYVDVGAEPPYGRLSDQEQVWGTAQFHLGYGWSMLGGLRYDLERDKLVRGEIGFGYDCDCFAFQVYYRRDNTSDRDIEKSDAVMLRLEFKTLGSSKIGAGL